MTEQRLEYIYAQYLSEFNKELKMLIETITKEKWKIKQISNSTSDEHHSALILLERRKPKENK